MGRLLILSGVLLTIAAVIFMLVTLGVFGEETAGRVIIPFACEEGDTIRTQSRMSFSNSGSGQTIDFFCVDSEGEERDVTMNVVGIIIVGFGGLLTTGIIMSIVGGMMGARRMQQNFMGQLLGQQGRTRVSSSVFDIRTDNGTDFPENNPEDVQSVLKQVFSQMGQPVSNNDDSLAGKLKQLDEARQQGLISREEYDRMRQAVLDGIDD